MSTQKREAMIRVAELSEQAVRLLQEVKQIAEENGIVFDMQDIYEEVTGDSMDWNSSSQYC